MTAGALTLDAPEAARALREDPRWGRLAIGTLTTTEAQALHDEAQATEEGRALWDVYRPHNPEERARIYQAAVAQIQQGAAAGMKGIEWCDETRNIVRGCSPVSAGCTNCYATRSAVRQSGPGGHYEGLVKLGQKGRFPGSTKPPQWTGKVQVVKAALLDIQRGAPRRLFVNSMGDVFHESFTNEQIAALFGAMATSPHTLIAATKRARRAAEWFEWVASQGRPPFDVCRGAACDLVPELVGKLPAWCERVWPLPNVWLLCSVEDQRAARERLPAWTKVPAAVLGVSAEPLLEQLDLRPWLPRLDWVIGGGESGPRARTCSTVWIDRLAIDCDLAGVAFFCKQLGARSTGRTTDTKGADPSQWPASLAGRRAFPQPGAVAARRRAA